MLDYEKLRDNQIVALLSEQTALLRSIKEAHDPIATVEQLQKRLTPYEFELAKISKVKMHSLGEILQATAEVKGYKSVEDMLEAEARAERREKKHAGFTIDDHGRYYAQ